MKINIKKMQKFTKNLPFILTSAQRRAISGITNDMKKKVPANRLLEGDVGSGKTIVAAAAAYIAHDNSFNALFAAPTEILAFQHEKTLKEILSPYKISVG